MNRVIGPTQQRVLAAMSHHSGYWTKDCGWYWNTVAGTGKIMESLHKRGLVTKTIVDGAPRYELITKE